MAMDVMMYSILAASQQETIVNLRYITRWGTPVFNQEVYNNAWGGTTDGGSALEDGTYYFVLTHNNEIRVKSAVTILNNF